MAEKKKKNRLGYMILSIAIAITSWIAVSYIYDPDIVRTIPGVKIEVVGEDALKERGLVLLDRSKLPKMSVKIKGKRSGVIKAMDSMQVVIDVSSIESPGDYRIAGAAKVQTGTVAVDRILSNSVDIKVDKISTREMPIKIYQDGGVEGKIVETRSSLTTVSVSGASSELDKLNGVYATIDLNKSGAEGKTQIPVAIAPKDGVDSRDLTTLTILTNKIEVENIYYEPKEVSVIVESRNINEHTIDMDKTVVEPKVVTIGVKPGSFVETVVAVIGEYITTQTTATLEDNAYIYIPEAVREVTVTPAWISIAH